MFYSEHLFDKVDQDCDGLLDVADFKLLIKQIGLILNTREFYSVWLTLDKDRGGDVNFDEWFRWIKANTKDPVVKALQQSIRMTRMLGAAKGAMVYSVDQANSSGRKALAELFDCVDQDGSVRAIAASLTRACCSFAVSLSTDVCCCDIQEYWSMDELKVLVEDLKIDATSDVLWDAMQEMDQDNTGRITLREVKRWWSAAPSASPSGLLRSKLKLAAFTAKENGPILNVSDTSNEGAGEAEAYINELLSAAFQQKAVLQGTSLGMFGADNKIRLWLQHWIVNPYTDRALVLLIFANVVLMAVQTPGQGSLAPPRCERVQYLKNVPISTANAAVLL
eukprot:COSAG06_NODE_4560_length_4145_cov_1.345032_4_plen_336_part_00